MPSSPYCRGLCRPWSPAWSPQSRTSSWRYVYCAYLPTTASNVYHPCQSLLTPFAFLVYQQRDAVLDALENMPVDGRSGLEVLLQKWCEHTEFQGLWQGRVNVLALAALYTSERPSIQRVMVRGEMIIKPQTSKGESPTSCRAFRLG